MWEYVQVPVRGNLDAQTKRMNELGRDGWELVGIDQMIMFFKRPVQESLYAGSL